MSLLRRRRADPTATLPDDLQRLGRAVDLAEGHLPPPAVEAAQALVRRAAERQNLATGRTVVALLGATGSGKSSLFNALVGREIARAAARRPTTTRPLAAVWGDDDAAELLDWLEIPERTHVDPVAAPTRAHERADDLSGLVLLDLPDIDSTALVHRQIAGRMADTVDVLVWVLDPQKYADAIVHRDYLSPMAAHADVTLVVLNQVDTLDPAERVGVLRDLDTLLERDGLRGVEILATSARAGTGVAELRERIGSVAATARAARVRLAADVRTTADHLARAAEIEPGEARPPTEVHERSAARLSAAAAQAAGVDAVREAVRGSYV
ncbi:GTPase, partial [Georgenia subflava]